MASSLAKTLFGDTPSGREYFVEYNGTCFRYHFFRCPHESEPAIRHDDGSAPAAHISIPVPPTSAPPFSSSWAPTHAVNGHLDERSRRKAEEEEEEEEEEKDKEDEDESHEESGQEERAPLLSANECRASHPLSCESRMHATAATSERRTGMSASVEAFGAQTINIGISQHAEAEDVENSPQQPHTTEPTSSSSSSSCLWGTMNSETSERHIPGCLVMQPYGTRFPYVQMFTISSIGDDQHSALMRFVNPHAAAATTTTSTNTPSPPLPPPPAARQPQHEEGIVTHLECVCYEQCDTPGTWRMDAPWDVMLACFTPNNGFDHFGLWTHLWMTHLVLYVMPIDVTDADASSASTSSSSESQLSLPPAPRAMISLGELKFQCRASLKFFNSFIALAESRTCMPFEALYAEELQNNHLFQSSEGEEEEEEEAKENEQKDARAEEKDEEAEGEEEDNDIEQQRQQSSSSGGGGSIAPPFRTDVFGGFGSDEEDH